MSLYAITDELSRLFRAYEDHGAESGEFADALREHTDALTEAFDAKADDYAALIRTAEARAEARKTEADRMRRLSQDDDALANRLRSALLESMKRLNISRTNTARFRISVATNGGAVPVIIPDETAIPDQYRVPRMSFSVDREALRAALERGENVEGASLGVRGIRLNIK